MTTKNMIQADYLLDESDMHNAEMNQKQTVDRPMASIDEHKKEQVTGEEEPADKLVDGIQNNDKTSKSKPWP